jgi:glycosyltransferase involved in cell wall biosynthesis
MVKVTVLMTAYNEEKHIRKSINSILSQSFSDFELIIVDDCSTDATVAIINSYKDPRIRLHKNKKNLGCSLSSNKGLKLATGTYVARQDADDVSKKNRLSVQVLFMENNPEVGLCGSWLRYMYSHVKRKGPTTPEETKARLFFQNVMSHPTVMFRKSVFEKNNILYNPDYLIAHDYDIFCIISQKTEVTNIGKTLLKYRYHKNSISLQKRSRTLDEFREIRLLQLANLNITPSKEEGELHALLLGDTLVEPGKKKAVLDWANKLKLANLEQRVYHLSTFDDLIDACMRKVE